MYIHYSKLLPIPMKISFCSLQQSGFKKNMRCSSLSFHQLTWAKNGRGHKTTWLSSFMGKHDDDAEDDVLERNTWEQEIYLHSFQRDIMSVYSSVFYSFSFRASFPDTLASFQTPELPFFWPPWLHFWSSGYFSRHKNFLFLVSCAFFLVFWLLFWHQIFVSLNSRASFLVSSLLF